jgi:hypothetical protein
MRGVTVLLTFTSVIGSSLVTAQSWSAYSGVAARTEYSDNYFLAVDNEQSAFTGSIAPFLIATRRTETSDVAALIALGANKVWGEVSTSEYWSGRFALDGSLRDERSKRSGTVSFIRTPLFQTTADNVRTAKLALAYTNTAVISGTYSYDIAERWSLDTNAAVYDNKYTSVEGNAGFEDNHGYTARATITYIWSDRTQIDVSADYLHNISDVSADDWVTGTLRVVHRFSPRMTTWLSAGALFAKSETREQMAIPVSNRPRQSDRLFGGGISYDLAEGTNVVIAYSEHASPSGGGFVSKEDRAVISLTHRHRDRLTARLGGGYSNTDFYRYYRGEIGASYALAERWTLELAYRYTRAYYPESPAAHSNGAFVSVAYNWPGTSYTEWTGGRDVNGAVGTGPLLAPGAPKTPTDVSSDQSLLQPFTIP